MHKASPSVINLSLLVGRSQYLILIFNEIRKLQLATNLSDELMSFSAPETNFGRRQPMSEKKLNSQLIIGGLQTIAVEAYLAGELPLLTAMQFSA